MGGTDQLRSLADRGVGLRTGGVRPRAAVLEDHIQIRNHGGVLLDGRIGVASAAASTSDAQAGALLGSRYALAGGDLAYEAVAGMSTALRLGRGRQRNRASRIGDVA